MSPETGILAEPHRQLVFAALRDKDPYVQRAAADALGQHTHGTEHGDYEPIRQLLDLRQRIPAPDQALLHVCRMTLRNQLRSPGAFPHWQSLNLSEPDSRAIADVALGVPGDESASFLLEHLRKFSEPRDTLLNDLRHAGRYAPEAQLLTLADVVRTKFPGDPDAQFTSYKSVQEGFSKRGTGLSESLRDWAANLAEQLLAPMDESRMPWISLPVKGAESADNPWMLQKRKSADGDQNSVFLSSLPAGETLTGIIQSRPFVIPPKLSFFVAGHDGEPDHPPVQRNSVRLLDASTHETLIKVGPPRNDEAQRVAWDLSQFAGRQGVLQLVDGHDDDGYAWLAAGRFEPAVVTMPDFIPNSASQRQQNAADLVRTVPLPKMEARMAQLLAAEANTPSARAASARALVALNQQTYLPILANSLADTNQPVVLREKLAFILAELNSPAAREAVLSALGVSPRRSQIKLAQTLAANPAGAEALLAVAESRKLSPQILLDQQVKERLVAAKLPQFKQRYEKLTAGLAPASAEMQKLINSRHAAFNPELASAERGRTVFEKTCAVCHQIDGKGVVIGPQLDGVGNRGLERLIEDVLDPNRNVDPAFHSSNVTLKDDTAITGLLRREEGEVLVFADSTGKEITVPKKEIAERRESELSLMPANFGDVLSVEEFNDLMAFLLAHGAK